MGASARRLDISLCGSTHIGAQDRHCFRPWLVPALGGGRISLGPAFSVYRTSGRRAQAGARTHSCSTCARYPQHSTTHCPGHSHLTAYCGICLLREKRKAEEQRSQPRHSRIVSAAPQSSPWIHVSPVLGATLSGAQPPTKFLRHLQIVPWRHGRGIAPASKTCCRHLLRALWARVRQRALVYVLTPADAHGLACVEVYIDAQSVSILAQPILALCQTRWRVLKLAFG